MGDNIAVGDLVAYLDRHAELTPDRIVVEVAGSAVSFRRLSESLRSYGAVTDRHRMAGAAALYAGLLHCLPEVAGMPNAIEQAGVLLDIIEMLSRTMADDDPPPTGAPAGLATA